MTLLVSFNDIATGSLRKTGWFAVRHLYRLMSASPVVHLAIWFVTNTAITIYSKALFKDFRFPYPLLLTAVHLLFTWLMALIVSSIRPSEPPPRWSWKAIKKYVLFSAIFTLNIWLSNYSLLIATIGVHQIVRTTIPLFTMWFSWLFFHEKYSLRLLPSVLLVIVGVLLTVWSDRLEVELFGIAVVVAGCVFSSLKGIMTRNIQLNMDTIQVFKVICPISVLMLTVASICIGELSRAAQTYEHRQNMDLVIQGVLAAALNYVSFKCASLNSPLTMNIAGNVKQMVTPLMAHLLISSSLTKGGSIGILATLLGALWYTVLINRAKQPLITPTATHAELAETESKTAQNSEEQMV